MGFAEILVILIVAVLVIKPAQLSGLIKKFAQLFNGAKKLKQEVQNHFEDEVNQHKLTENQRRAEAADEYYKNNNKDHDKPTLD